MSAQPGARTSEDPYDPSIPHPARRYNYWLGGRENYLADRLSGDAIAAAMPTIRLGIWENRAFLRRAVRFMTESGIRQFIDVGPGIPAPDCSHEVAQAIAPETKVLYVDNDPVVIAYSRALLRNGAITDGAEGGTVSVNDLVAVEGSVPGDARIPAGFDPQPYPENDVDGRGLIGHVLADVCDAKRILGDRETCMVIDFTKPVGLLLVAVAHFCTDDETVFPAVHTLVDALAPGSMVAFSHAVADYVDPRIVANVETANSQHSSPFRWRYTFDCAKFAQGLEFVEPGLVSVEQWRADEEAKPRPKSSDVGICAFVATKPAPGAEAPVTAESRSSS